MPDEVVVESLCADLIRAKEIESSATEARVAVERQIIEQLGLPDEGSKTNDAGNFKVTITQKINRKLDEKKWLTILDKIPEHLRPVKIVETYKLEDAGVRYLKVNEPGYFRIMAAAIEEKPAKPSVKVEEA